MKLRALGTVLIFAILGPLLGLLGIDVFVAIKGAPPMSWATTFSLLPRVLVFCLIPAFFTGISYLGFSGLRTSRHRLLLRMLIGGLLGCLFSGVWIALIFRSAFLLPDFAVAGMFAGALCAAISPWPVFCSWASRNVESHDESANPTNYHAQRHAGSLIPDS